MVWWVASRLPRFDPPDYAKRGELKTGIVLNCGANINSWIAVVLLWFLIHPVSPIIKLYISNNRLIETMLIFWKVVSIFTSRQDVPA